MLVYRDPRQPVGLRLEAAKTALPYDGPRLASIEAKHDDDDLDNMTREELEVVVYGRPVAEIEEERRAQGLLPPAPKPSKPKLVSSRTKL
jgi:hypothetical protein